MSEPDAALAPFTAAQLANELERRAQLQDAEAVKELEDFGAAYAPDDGFDLAYDGPEPDALFQKMSDWDRDELERAVARDDGRRVVDILRSQLA